MRAKFLLLLLCVVVITVNAQEDQPSLLNINIGDPAPPLRVREWLKGAPVWRFEKGKVFVIEFWATWCKPCVAAMSRLSALASGYKNSVCLLCVDIYEKKTTSLNKIKAFVDSIGNGMNYSVALEDSNFMETGWLDAFEERRHGIPRSFVVNAEGRVAWIGHPKDIEKILPKIVNNTWDINEALIKWKSDKHLEELDDSLNYELIRYKENPYEPGNFGKPDSMLLVIDLIIKKEPKLKYAPFIAYNTFSSLLKTNLHQAYEYGKAVIVTPSYGDPAYDNIIGAIELYSDRLKLPTEIYKLGAEACQLEIDQLPYPEIVDLSKRYYRMAHWYLLAGDKSNALYAQKKAIKALKKK